MKIQPARELPRDLLVYRFLRNRAGGIAGGQNHSEAASLAGMLALAEVRVIRRADLSKAFRGWNALAFATSHWRVMGLDWVARRTGNIPNDRE